MPIALFHSQIYDWIQSSINLKYSSIVDLRLFGFYYFGVYGEAALLAAVGRFADLWSTLRALEEPGIIESNPTLGTNPSWKSLAKVVFLQISLIAAVFALTIYFPLTIPYVQPLWVFIATLSFAIYFSNIILKRIAKIGKSWPSWVVPMPIAGIFMVLVLDDPTLGYGFILASYWVTVIVLWVICKIHEIWSGMCARDEAIRHIGRTGFP